MASFGIAPGGQHMNQEGGGQQPIQLFPIPPTEGACNQEIDSLLKDFTSVIEDVIVPKNVWYWALYWSSWPNIPKLAPKSITGISETRRYSILLQSIRSLVDRMLGFHLCYLGILVWSIVGLLFHIILAFDECYGCVIAQEIQVVLAVTSITAFSSVLVLLLFWMKRVHLSRNQTLCMLALLAICHGLSIIRMVMPGNLGNLLFRVICLRSLGEIPLMSQQHLSTGWVRKLILDSGKVCCVVLQLVFVQNRNGVFSTIPSVFGIGLYFCCLITGFAADRSEIIAKKKFAVGVERLSERIFQLLMAIDKFGGKLPDKIYHMPKSSSLAVMVNNTKSKFKTYPTFEGRSANSILPVKTNSEPKNDMMTPRETLRPLTKVQSNRKILNLQLTESIARHPSAQKQIDAGELGEKKNQTQPLLKSAKPLQRKQLSPLVIRETNPPVTVNPKKLVSLELDQSPKFGPIMEDRAPTFNSPTNKSPKRQPTNERVKTGSLNTQGDNYLRFKDALADLYLGDSTACVLQVEAILEREDSEEYELLASLPDKFTDVMRRANNAQLKINCLQLLKSMRVGDFLLPDANISGKNLHSNWAYQELEILLERIHHDFTFSFKVVASRLYSVVLERVSSLSGWPDSSGFIATD